MENKHETEDEIPSEEQRQQRENLEKFENLIDKPTLTDSDEELKNSRISKTKGKRSSQSVPRSRNAERKGKKETNQKEMLKFSTPSVVEVEEEDADKEKKIAFSNTNSAPFVKRIKKREENFSLTHSSNYQIKSARTKKSDSSNGEERRTKKLVEKRPITVSHGNSAITKIEAKSTITLKVIGEQNDDLQNNNNNSNNNNNNNSSSGNNNINQSPDLVASPIVIKRKNLIHKIFSKTNLSMTHSQNSQSISQLASGLSSSNLHTSVSSPTGFQKVEELAIIPPTIPKLSVYQHRLTVPNNYWNLESAAECDPNDSLLYDWPLQYNQFESTLYIHDFYEKLHENYFAVDKILGNIIISLRKDRARDRMLLIYRSKRGDINLECSLRKKKSSSKNLIRDTALLHSLNLTALKAIYDPELQDHLVRYEKAGVFKRFKFGVLLIREGQTKDDEYFSNQEGSERWNIFLECIGKKTPLANFPHYNGGLDVSGNNNTGEYSYYYQYRSITDSKYDIMFHISTFLPFFPNCSQQVERKRHLGNDVVNVIFIDCDNGIFDPASIVTNFIHVYIIVRMHKFDPQNLQKNKFMVEVIAQGGVGEFGPPIPNPPIFSFNKLRKWLHTKLINAERASFLAANFKFKFANTRKEIINEIVEKFGGTK